MSQPKLYICYSINDFYAREAGISLLSFLENNPGYEPEEVFFVDYGIHPVNRAKLDGIATRYGKHITYLNGRPVTGEVKRLYPNYPAWKGSMAACIKPFMDKIMPDYVQRLLYIDADTIVAGSIRELQEMDMGNAVVAGTISDMMGHALQNHWYELYSGNTQYMGSGVLLFDLKNWRREDCYHKMVYVLQRKRNLRLPDQMLLNNAIPQRLMKVLPTKFNYTMSNYHPWQVYQWMRRYGILSEEECREAIDHPVIIHYLTGWELARPWHKGCRSQRKEEYYRYKALSPWKDDPLAPPIQKLNPPKGFHDKFLFWSHLQVMKPRPYFFAVLMESLYIRYHCIYARGKGINLHSDEGIEACDYIVNK